MGTIISYSERKKAILLKHKKEKQQSRLVKSLIAFTVCVSITFISIAAYNIYNSSSKNTEKLPLAKYSSTKLL